MPDIFIWMISNGKRLAYHRISARDIIYSDFPDECGKHCGKMQTLFLKVKYIFSYIAKLFNHIEYYVLITKTSHIFY